MRWIKENANKIRIDDLDSLSYEINNIREEDRMATNHLYGHASNFKRFAGIDENKILKCTIEHGINIYNDNVCAPEVWHPVRKILTYSLYRKELIEKVTRLEAIPVGPYIEYAESYYDEKVLRVEKEKLGRTLLVFPQHTIQETQALYSREEFINEINRVRKNFDTVIICMYYNDLKRQEANLYLKKGYIVVSAGSKYDKYFLSRLKSILQLSDAVMGNAYTTGLTYALYYKKPIYIYNQDIVVTDTSLSNVKHIRRNTILECLLKISSDSSFCNLKHQLEWGNYYFGFDQIKSKEAMNQLLESMLR